MEPPRTPAVAVLAADRPVHPGAARDGGPRGTAPGVAARRPTWRAAPPRRRSPSSSSCTAPACPPARRWTGCRHWRLHLTVLACTFVVFPLLGLAARGLEPAGAHPAALQRAALPLPGPVDHPVLDRLHLDRPRQRARRDLRGLLLLPRRHRRSPRCSRPLLLGGSAGGFSADSLVEDRPAAAGAVPGRAAAAPLDRRLHHPPQEGRSASSTGARSCSSSTRPSARAWSRASGTR